MEDQIGIGMDCWYLRVWILLIVLSLFGDEIRGL